MADPTAFYEPEEDELLSSLAVPAYQDHEEEYRRLQELEQHAYAQQIAAAQEAEIEQGLELVPEDVKKVRFENDLPTITNMYEQGWNKLTNVSGRLQAALISRHTTLKTNGPRRRSLAPWSRTVGCVNPALLTSRPGVLDLVPRGELL